MSGMKQFDWSRFTLDPTPDLVAGKRYRVIREGVARDESHVVADSGLVIDVTFPGTTVELLPDPLPTTPGSGVLYVRDDLGDPTKRQSLLLRLEEDNAWHGLKGGVWTTRQLQSEANSLHGEITVLFDAGAQR